MDERSLFEDHIKTKNSLSAIFLSPHDPACIP